MTVSTSVRSGRVVEPVQGAARSGSDPQELARLVRDHVHDWARVELHSGRTVCGWVCGAPAGAVDLYHDPHRADQTVRVPVEEIASIEFTGDTHRWVVPWYL